MEELLSVDSLTVEYTTLAGNARAVNNVSLEVRKGETVGLVGESGCGKSTLGMATMGLIQPPGRVTAGKIFFEGNDLTLLSSDELRKIRGKRIAMIFQDPMTSLNPVKRVSDHFVEYARAHDSKTTKQEALAKTATIMRDLGIPAERAKDYPHQFSGGMRQRVMIGLALALNPALIIADEPTTALDVIVEAQILELMRELKRKYSLSLLLITHNMGIVAEMADRVAVMYAGSLVEVASVWDIFGNPKHPYTKALLESIPTVGAEGRRLLKSIKGSPPDLTHPPQGCPFHPRCSFAFDRCRVEDPKLLKTGEGSAAACHLLEVR
jgi:oligopeptide/dipeptide ABC transporter ATP-binding protein